MDEIYPQIAIAGENALIVYFGDHPSAFISAKIAQTVESLHTVLGDLIIDWVPSYASLLVSYDPLRTDHFFVGQTIRRVLQSSADPSLQSPGGRVCLSVYYSMESGPDLARLADRANLSIDAVITLHQQTEYTVYAVGFAPGFAYLGEVDQRLAMPRQATPRRHVPAGSVAVADRQTAVYPSDSPGGWNLIGRCPEALFNPQKDPSSPFKVGDRVHFNSISRDTYLAMGGML